MQTVTIEITDAGSELVFRIRKVRDKYTTHAEAEAASTLFYSLRQSFDEPDRTTIHDDSADVVFSYLPRPAFGVRRRSRAGTKREPK